MKQLDFETAKLILQAADALHILQSRSPAFNAYLTEQNLGVDWDAVEAVEREATVYLIKYYADHLLSVNRPETEQKN